MVKSSKDKNREYREKNPEKLKAIKAAWRRNNPEKVKKHRANYYEKHKEKVRAYASSWVKKNPRKLLRAQLRRQYGLPLEEYDSMVLSQEGRCKICNSQMTRLREPCVDHDHVTGKVRGLLCLNCNVAIGLFLEDGHILLRAMAYLDGAL